MNEYETESSGGKGIWIFLVFLLVLALHAVAILGIAVFNGWKFNGIGLSPAQNTGSAQPQPVDFVKNTLPETALAPAPKIEPPSNDEKVSLRKQTSLEKQILSDAGDEDLAIPDRVFSEPVTVARKDEAVKASPPVMADGATHEKTSRKAAAPQEPVKKTDSSDAGLIESGPGLAMPSASKGKTASPVKNLAAPVLVAASASKKAPASGNASYGTYTVQKGDTFNKIARQFNTTLDQLYKLNSIKDPNGLKAGTILKVPGR